MKHFYKNLVISFLITLFTIIFMSVLSISIPNGVFNTPVKSELNLSWVSLFFHNLVICFLLELGLFTLAVPTFILSFINSSLIAVVSVAGIKQYGIFALLSSLLPHGITELLAVLISTAIGLNGLVFYRISPCQKRKLILDSIKITIAIVIPLLLFSAIMETYVSCHL